MDISRLLNNMIIPGIVLAVALVMMVVESRHSGRNWPKVRGWC
jgi:cytochrome c oxidase subunit IV